MPNTLELERIKVLLVVEQCNPERPSVPLEGWNYFQAIAKYAEVTLVTHGRNREAIEKTEYAGCAVYITESRLTDYYHAVVERLLKLVFRGKINWPIYHFLTYPIYAEFNHKVYRRFSAQVAEGKYDVVHALTPMMPRYPVKLVQACGKVPFLLGPVNGGIPFPQGFQQKAKEEFAHFNFLRTLGRFLIPGYRQTYRQATKVLAGSTYTLEMLRKLFHLSEPQLELFYENGIPKSFLEKPRPEKSKGDRVNLLFVGRLVPYKCADVVIEAIARLKPSLQNRLSFTIVGDGSEKATLEAKVQELGLSHLVTFTGWVDHEETSRYYSQSDIFCFPSIREFGGAVVLEAMACGLPCIVAKYGGIGEYVTDSTGYRIEPISKEFLTQAVAQHIQTLVEDPQLRSQMSKAAVERAQEFEWETKVKGLIAIYHTLVDAPSPALAELPHPAEPLRIPV